VPKLQAGTSFPVTVTWGEIAIVGEGRLVVQTKFVHAPCAKLKTGREQFSQLSTTVIPVRSARPVLQI
jgi:hypothetical protein